MNKAYRLVWSAAKNLWVVAAEIVKTKRGKSPVAAVGHVTTNKPDSVTGEYLHHDEPRFVGRPLRLSSFVMALEPRFMFDAAAVATVDTLSDHTTDTTDSAVTADSQTANDSSVDATSSLLDAITKTIISSDITASVADRAPVEIAFVDPRLRDSPILVDGISPGVRTVLLDPTQDGIAQITEALRTAGNVSAIHILGHGSPGTLMVGSTELTSETLASRSTEFSAWKANLTEQADILIYGCDVAQGSVGSGLITSLSQITSADVAASTDLTGAAERGGDWTLEATTGIIDVRSFAIDAYRGLLDVYTDTPVVAAPVDQSGTEDTPFSFGSIVEVSSPASDRMEAVVSVISGSGTLSDGEISFDQLASQGDITGINAFLSSLTFQGAQDWNGTATIEVAVTSDFNNRTVGNTTTITFDIVVGAVADAPVTGVVSSLTAVAEDTTDPAGATVSSLLGGFSDVDGDTLAGIAISGNPLDASHGAWEYSVDGTTWLAVGSVDASSALLLGKESLLRYTPAENWFGTPGSLTLRAIDSSTSRSFSTAGSRATGALNASTSDIAANDSTLGTSVTPVNDAPTTADASVSGNKNQTSTFSLSSTDPDTGTNSSTDAIVTQYRIVSIPTDGVLKTSTGTTIGAGAVISVAQATNMTFTPDTNFVGSPTFTYQAIDAAGAESDAGTVTVTIAPFNEPPVVTVPGAQTVAEDGTLTIASGISIADVDAGSGTIQITIGADHGNVAFADLTGLSVTSGANNSHSITVQGTVTDINTALGSSNFSYSPDTNYPNSTLAATDTITIVADDLGNTGSPAKTDTQTISVTVTPVADAPVTAAGESATLTAVNEDTVSPSGASIASLLSGKFSDADGNILAGIAISADASNGAEGLWQYSLNEGQTWAAIGTVSDTSALLLDFGVYLRFLPAENYYGTPGELTIHAVDNSGSRTYTTDIATPQTIDVTAGGTDLDATGTALSTSITSVNDVFVVEVAKNPKVDEGGTVVLTDSFLKITDIEAAPGEIVYTILAPGTDLSEGTLQLDSAHDGSWATTLGVGDTFTQEDIDNAYIRYVHDGNEPAVPQTLAYSVTDITATGGGTTADRSLTIKVSPVNDVPVLYLPGDTAPDDSVLAANVASVGGSLTFSTAQIQVTDTDNTSQQLVFRLESLPTYGELALNGAAVAVGTVFNYANLGQLVYTHDGTQSTSDTFNVSLRDGAGGVITATAVDLTIGPDNTAPTGIGNLTADIYEDPLTSSGSNPGRAIESFSGYLLSDADVGASVGGIAIIGNTTSAAQGVWQYSTDGSYWSAIGTVNDTGSALVLAPDTLVRFVPAADYNGTPTPLTIRVLDNTYADGVSTSDGSETRVTVDTSVRGGATAISDNTNILGITVIAVDDDPVLLNNNGGTLNTETAVSISPDGNSSFPTLAISSSMLQVTDVDSPNTDLTFTLVNQPSHGYMARYQDGAWTQLLDGANFTQNDINSGTVRYIFTGDPSTDTNDSFDFTVTDGNTRIKPTERPGGIYPDTDTLTLSTLTFALTIDSSTPVPSNPGGAYTFPTTTGGANAAPSVAVGTLTLSEGDQGVTVTTSVLNATDADTAKSDLIYSLVSLPTSGTLRLNGSILTINSTFTQADVENGLVTFSHYGYENFIDSFRFFVTDGNTVTDIKTAQIDVTPVNDRPYIDTVASVKTLEGNSIVLQGGSNLLSGESVSTWDVDGIGSDKSTGFAQVNTLTFTISGLPTNGEVRLVNEGETYDQDNSATYSVVDTGTIISATDLNDGKLYYAHDGGETTSDTLTFTVNDNSGEANATNSASLTIKIVPVNDDPVITINSGSVVPSATVSNFQVAEGGSNVIANTYLLSTDPDNTTAQVQFRITSDVQYGQLMRGAEVLGVGSAITQEEIDDGLISYVHDGLESTGDSFDYTLSDGGGGNEPTGTFVITILPANDAPIVTLPTTRQAVEDLPLSIAGISIGDPDSVALDESIDSDFGPLEVTLTAGHGTLDLTASGAAVLTGDLTSSVTISGTLGEVNATLASLIYTGTANYNGADSIQVDVTDNGNSGSGGALTDSQILDINIAAVNDAPIATVPGVQSVNEDTALVFNGNLSVSDYFDTDQAGATDYLSVTLGVGQGTLTAVTGGGAGITDNGTTSVTIAGTRDQINAALNGLSYQGILNYHGSDTLTLTVSDQGNTGVYGGTKTDSKTVAITVAPVNDAPTTTALGFSGAEDSALTVDLSSADVDDGAHGAMTTDAVVDRYRIDTLPLNGTLEYNNGSGWVAVTAGQIVTKAQGENLRFTPDLNFNNSQGSVSFTFTALDAADAESNTRTATITITAVNDAPTLTGAGDAGLTFAENSSGTLNEGSWLRLDTNGDFALLNDIELIEQTSPLVDTFNSSSLTVQRNGGAVTSDRFQIDTSYGGDGKTVAVVGTTVSVDGTEIGTITDASTTTGQFIIVFNGTAAQADVSAVMARIAYNSVSDNLMASSPLTVAVIFNDGNAGEQGSGGAKTATGTFVITVTNVNDAPSFTGNGSITVAEDTADPTGSSVDTIMGAKFSDPDSGVTGAGDFAGIAIVSNDSDAVNEGAWQYSVDNETWTDVGAVSTGSALLLSKNTLVRFVPVANFNDMSSQASNPTDGLTVYAVDNSGSRTYTTVGSREFVDTVTGWSDSSDIGAAGSALINVSVTQVNDAPTIANLDGDTAGFYEAVGVNLAGTAVLLDDPTGGLAALTDIDLTTREETTFNGATLTVQQAGTADTDDFYVVQVGSGITISGGYTEPGSGLKLFNNGSLIRYNNITVATLTDNSDASGRLTLTFNANADKAAVDAVLKNLAFSNNNDAITQSSKTIRITFNDGNGSTNNSQGTGGALSTYADVIMTISPTNDAPTFTAGASISTVEDTTSTPITITDLLGSKFSDSDSVSSLAGVVISGYDDVSKGNWEVYIGTSWVTLASLDTTIGGISTSKALLLSAATQIRFVPTANLNTADPVTQPTLAVHAVEDSIPTGAPNGGAGESAGVITFTSDAASPLTFNTTADTLESRVSVDAVTVDLTIAERNDAPVLSGTTYTGTLTESPVLGVGTAKQALLTEVSVTDLDLTNTGTLDSSTFGAGTITVVLTDGSTGDMLTVEGSPSGIDSIDGTHDGEDGESLVVNLKTDATLAQVQNILEAINFQHTSDNPPSGARSYTITLNDGNNLDADGDTAGGPTSLNAATVLTGDITIAGVNDPPTLTATATDPTYVENTAATLLFSSADASTDLITSDQTLVEIKLTVSGLVDGAYEKLTIDGLEISLTDGNSGTTTTNSGSVSVSVTGNTATVTFTHTGLTEAQTNALVNSLAYRNSSEDPTAASGRVVTITSLKDNGGTANSGEDTTSLSITSTVTLTPAPDKPVMSAGGTLAYTENGTATVIDATVAVVSDADDTELAGATVTIGSVVSGDVLSFSEQYGITGGYTAGTGVLALSGTATLTEYQEVLRSVTYASTSDDPTVNDTRASRAISWQVTDADSDNAGAATSTAVTSTVNLTAVNDTPVVAGLSGAGYTENGSAVTLGGSLTLTDADDTQLTGATVSITGNLTSGDTLNFTDQLGITGSYNAGVLTLSGSATLADYRTALRGITFSTSSDDPTVNGTAATRTLSWQVTDADSDNAGAQVSTAQNQTLSITPAQDAPVLTVTGALAYTENTGATTVDNMVTVTDADDTQISGGSVSLTGNFLAGDVLAVTNTGNITGSYNSGTGVLTLSGTDTLAHYQTVLRSLTYHNTTDDPTHNAGKTSRTLTYSLTDANSDSAGAATGTTTKTINLTPLQDAPVLTGGGQTLDYTENASATVIDTTVTVASDADDTELAGATVTISAGYTSGDTLGFSDQNGITGSYDSGAGVLTLSGSASLADYTTALQSVRYSSSSDDPTATSSSRTLSWQVTDANSDNAGAANSNTLTSTINLTAVNDAPMISVTDVTGTITEGSTLNENGSITFTDADHSDRPTASKATKLVSGLRSDGTTFFTLSDAQQTAIENAFSISAADGNDNNGTIDWDYTILETDLDFLAVGEKVTAVFTITLNDGQGGTDTQDVTLAITGTNDTPTAIADSNNTAETTPLIVNAEDGVLNNDTDLDLSDGHTVSEVNETAGKVGVAVAGTNGGTFNIAADGSYTFDPDGDFDDLAVGENRTTSVNYINNDGHGGTSGSTLTITVTGGGNSPTVSVTDPAGFSEALDASAQSLNDSGTINFDDIDTTNVIDITFESNDDITWSGGAIDTDLATQLVAGFSAAATDADAPGNTPWTYSVNNADLDFLAEGETITFSYTVTATDNNGKTDTDTISFTITGNNDAPVIAAVDVTGDLAEGSVLSDSGSMTFTDVDLSDVPTASKAAKSITALRSDGTTHLTLNGAQQTLFAEAFTVTPADDNGHNGTINWDYTITESNLDFLAAGETVTAIFTITVDDGQGGTDTQDVTVTIVGTNDAAVLSADVVDLTETDSVLTTHGNLAISDVDNAEGFIAQTGTVGSYGTFAIDAAGSWSYTTSSAHDEFVPGTTYSDSFTVTSSDGTTTSVTINILGTDDFVPLLEEAPSSTTATNNNQPLYNGYERNDSLYLSISPSSQIALVNETGSFTLPSGLFRHTDRNAQLKIDATLTDGRALPSWLTFDSNSGSFTGIPPEGSSGALDIRISARDQQGNVAFAEFSLKIMGSTDTQMFSGSMGDDPLREAGIRAKAMSGLEARESGIVLMGDGTHRTLGAYGLSLIGSISEREVLVDRPTTFNLPKGLFRHSEADALVTISATLADGSPLPEWISFDAANGRFVVRAPLTAGDVFDIRIVARDQDGNEASTHFLIHIRNNRQPVTGEKGHPVHNEKTKAGDPPLPPDMTFNTDAREGIGISDTIRATNGRPSLSEQLASLNHRASLPIF